MQKKCIILIYSWKYISFPTMTWLMLGSDIVLCMYTSFKLSVVHKTLIELFMEVKERNHNFLAMK